jgi:hypothetical protein
MTRFRLGLVGGFAAGYYLGAKAGRERYLQISRTLGRARESHLIEKVVAAVDLGRERLRSNAHDAQGELDLRAPSMN